MNLDKRVKVLYIAGAGRSGSTVLERILGQIDGFFSVGELCHIWQHDMIENRLCGCGVSLQDCRVWKEILDRAYGSIDSIDAHEMISMAQHVRLRHLVRPSRRAIYPSKYLENLERLYLAIQASTASKVIIDSSKYPAYGSALGMIPTIDLYVVQLVRDPRAVTYSWSQKIKAQPGTRTGVMESFGPVQSAFMFNVLNVMAERCFGLAAERYLLLRYEDFVREPQKTVQDLLGLVREDGAALPFVTPHSVQLGIGHMVSGNPNRFLYGTVNLRLDDEWKTRIKLSNWILTTALAWPLLIRYGYCARGRE